MKITNNDLQVMLVEIRADVKSVVKDVSALTGSFEAHVESDKKEFKIVNDNIASMNKYAASVAIVAGAIGAGATYMWSYLTGKA